MKKLVSARMVLSLNRPGRSCLPSEFKLFLSTKGRVAQEATLGLLVPTITFFPSGSQIGACVYPCLNIQQAFICFLRKLLATCSAAGAVLCPWNRRIPCTHFLTGTPCLLSLSYISTCKSYRPQLEMKNLLLRWGLGCLFYDVTCIRI